MCKLHVISDHNLPGNVKQQQNEMQVVTQK
jgi:hypothetical protein